MKSATWMALSLILGVWAPAVATATPTPPPPAAAATAGSNTGGTLLDMLRAMSKKVDAHDSQGALDLLRQIVQRPDFSATDRSLQHATWLLLAAEEIEKGSQSASYDAFVRATSFDDAAANDWLGRTEQGCELKKSVDCITSLAVLAQRYPKALDELNEHWLFQTVHNSVEQRWAPEQSLAAMNALYDDRWTIDGHEPDWLWADLAILLAGQGAINRAGAVAERVQSPEAVIRLLIDKRFDPVLAADSSRFDPDKLAAAEVARDEATWTANPRKLDSLVQLTYALLDVGQFQRVLELTDAAIAKATGHGGAKAFDDAHEKLNWIYDNRARALVALGRWDQAAATYAAGAKHEEGASSNVSQAINLGAFYNELGRPKDALAAIQEVADTSDFGRMQLEGVRFRAEFELGDAAAAAAKSFDYLKAHSHDAPDAYVDALLLKGDLDGAAPVVIQLLADPQQRTSTLMGLQDFQRPPPPPAEARLRAVRKALIARPDVAAAIAKVGRVQHFHLTSADF